MRDGSITGSKYSGMKTTREVIVLTGAGQIGTAIARRMGYGKKILVADWKLENANATVKTLLEAGFDAYPCMVDISSPASVQGLIETAQQLGPVSMLINAAGVSPSQATIEQILAVDLYGTAILLESFGQVIKSGGSGVTVSSQSAHRMPALSPETDRLLALTPAEELLKLDILKVENIGAKSYYSIKTKTIEKSEKSLKKLLKNILN